MIPGQPTPDFLDGILRRMQIVYQEHADYINHFAISCRTGIEIRGTSDKASWASFSDSYFSETNGCVGLLRIVGGGAGFMPVVASIVEADEFRGSSDEEDGWNGRLRLTCRKCRPICLINPTKLGGYSKRLFGNQHDVSRRHLDVDHGLSEPHCTLPLLFALICLGEICAIGVRCADCIGKTDS